MTRRIFRASCLVALAVFSAAVVLIMGILYDYFSNIQQIQLRMQLALAAQGASNDGPEYFQGMLPSYGSARAQNNLNYRITWIDTDGTVLYDSQADSAEMENHLARKEVKEALAAGYGESRRYSATLFERFLYAAQKLPDGTILRLSISQNSILTLLLGIAQPICAIIILALGLAALLAIRASRKIVEPLNDFDLDHPLSNKGYDELSPFLRRIDSQQKQLSRQKDELGQKQNELDTIIGSINEGMVLLNQKGKILSINPAAKKLLDAEGDCAGADMISLCRNLDLQEILAAALLGMAGERILRLHEESYCVNAEPIFSGQEPMGAALFFFNVTEEEKTEQMRREFTANVSHELKTPLHSISGYAELLKNGIVKEEDVVPFAARIYDESQRMICLVEDIITLSHLDEGAKDMEMETADLYELAKKAIQSLDSAAKVAHVSVTLTGMPSPVNGIRNLLYGMIYNLCDNAIKYNRENGKVELYIQKNKNETVLSVRDTGIGIAPEHQERIFERFYRVDKSHSKETPSGNPSAPFSSHKEIPVGGTGLGLSIVKHSAKIHRARIDLASTAGNGTEITVTFPAAG